MNKINSIEKSISKNTSVNTLISKQREIQRHSNDVAKYAKERSDISSKISNKRKSLVDKKISLQKEEKRESELQKKQQAKLLKTYETQIEELTKNLETNIEKDQKLSQKGLGCAEKKRPLSDMICIDLQRKVNIKTMKS